ncbi:hypothetical protein SAY86_012494 [Trapa natans]|uniref:Uncharacterized protein n=1 Tax=Trapa natans TaxID=22666 RepID=A0AAN7MD31_TRANT|nr:hypothetical protein SAY86_012494 [Trapa natans]
MGWELKIGPGQKSSDMRAYVLKVSSYHSSVPELVTGKSSMMQSSSLLLSNTTVPLTFSTLSSSIVGLSAPRSRNRLPLPVSASSQSWLPKSHLQNREPAFLSLQSNDSIEAYPSEAGYIEVGYISRVHGLEGEICVKPTTDFPELRFCKPGRRWLKQQVSGRDMLKEIKLVDGRGHPGQKSWILKFGGIDTVEQAEKLIGSTLLVNESDRPDLEAGEFYTRDLVGMRVIHKETAEAIGTVMSIYNSGASDLLHVQLDSPSSTNDVSEKSKEEICASERLIWIPFVEAIVPDVDINRREMFITPPKGLLELNLRSDTVSKKERRHLEWKERKRLQKHLIAAKKKLCELEQQHVFHGFRYGEKTQGRLLADQIMSVNSKMLQQALQNIQISYEIPDGGAKFLLSTRSKVPVAAMEKLKGKFSFYETGNRLTSMGKVAILLAVNGNRKLDIFDSHFDLEEIVQILHCDEQKLVKVEDRGSVPLILVSPSHQIKHLEKLFLENDYFAFNSEKVWFLEEKMLPIISSSTEEGKRHKILMKSPWEMLQSPLGSGGIIMSLSSQCMPEILSELGVVYIRVCSIDRISLAAPDLLLGLIKSEDAEIGIQVLEESKGCLDESFDMTFSLSFLNRLVKQIDKLQFFAIPKESSYVELVDKQWIDVVPSAPNSCVIRSSIYCCLSICSSDKVCLLDITK